MPTGSRNLTCSRAVRPSRMRIGTSPFSARSSAASSSLQQMIAGLGAAPEHLPPPTGAVLALLALRAVEARDWQMMFVWLGIALVVDAVDGPLARLLGVKIVLPRFSGERLDLIVDYLTYVVVPAFALTQATLLPEGTRVPAAIAILLSSFFH